MKKIFIVIMLTVSLAAQAQKTHKGPPPDETFNPETASIDLVQIRAHIKSLENKIAMYKVLASGIFKYTGLIVAISGGLDLANVLYASKADLYVIDEAERLGRGAMGLGLSASGQGGRLGGLVQVPTQVFNKFNNWGIKALNYGTRLLIINSRVVAGSVTLAGISWFLISWEYLPYLIRYNQVELNMLKSLEASIATEEENLSQPRR